MVQQKFLYGWKARLPRVGLIENQFHCPLQTSNLHLRAGVGSWGRGKKNPTTTHTTLFLILSSLSREREMETGAKEAWRPAVAGPPVFHPCTSERHTYRLASPSLSPSSLPLSLIPMFPLSLSLSLFPSLPLRPSSFLRPLLLFLPPCL